MGTSSSKQQPFDPTNPIKRDEKKPSLLARIQDHSLGADTHYSEEDLKKYTGKSSDELKTWMENAPNVGKNQKASKIGMGAGTGGAVTYSGEG
jgi:hypothetical protein